MNKRHFTTTVIASTFLAALANMHSAHAFEFSANLKTVETQTALLLPAVQQAASEAPRIEGLELLKKIGEYSQELTRYQAAKPTESDIPILRHIGEHMAKISETRLALDKPQRLGETRIAFRSPEDPSASFEIDQSVGNFLFNSGLNKFRKPENTPNLPWQNDLAPLAREHFTEFDLPINPRELEIEHVGGLNMAIADGSGASEIFEKIKTIRFKRNINGLPVEGDSRIIAHFGENSTLTGLVFQWPTIGSKQAISSKELNSPETMRAVAQKQLEEVSQEALSAKLTEVELVLYDDGKGNMEPAYHIVLERQLDLGERESTMIPFDFYLPVSQKPVAEIPRVKDAVLAAADGSNTERYESRAANE